ncbi:FAD-dependent oxidoreductase [Sulfitobacter sp. THAF37]|uniref:FAD-dependent oxidoreductase n=1 Tax=Sulfitobacter sp. THAF37 TaxID=2587855 RepID=UPI0020C7EE1B|nr:FAD-dependent oxidoreductase [Sulfitobacter sp. THAF37]
MAITRLGDRVRMADTAKIAGYSDSLGPHATDKVRYMVNDLFPGGGDISKAEGWTGLRPMTPDGTPVLGASGYRNLVPNIGYGTLDWTMTAGSGMAVSDVALDRDAAISSEGLAAECYGSYG